MAMVFKKQQNPSKQKPSEIDDGLIRQCKEFLAIKVPASNIVFVEEFAPYMPLFNKALSEQTDPVVMDKIAKDYNSRFSLQHPIQILSQEIDPKGVYHPGTRKYHKLNRTIPAMFRRVSTLNDLGKKVPTLINALWNATNHSSGPADTRKAQYSQQIAKAIVMADNRDGKVQQERDAFKQGASQLVSDKPGGNAKEEQTDDCMTGMFDW